MSFNDLLLWHIFKVSNNSFIVKRYVNSHEFAQTLEGCTEFDLIVDLTKCNSAQAPRVAFLERFLDLCPKSLFSKVKTVVLFQPNIESPRLLMNVHMLLRVLGKHGLCVGNKGESFNLYILTGSTHNVPIVTAGNPNELMKHIPLRILQLSRDSCKFAVASGIYPKQ